ncbi:MAG: rhodanese-related sulfurtransferase [Sphingorhabdus sp.]
MNSPKISVAAFYHFAPLLDYEARKDDLLALCVAKGLKGTILLAGEGINGTIAGGREDLDAALAHIRNWAGFAGAEAKFSAANIMPFSRMKVRLKKEIVAMGVPGVDAANNPGSYVDPHDWNSLIADPDVVIIDTRNDFEVALGSFPRAMNPETPSFRDFPGWFRAQAEGWKKDGRKPVIAMFCTGGIRCEKATAFVKDEGFEEVHHLKGGILKYLEEIPVADSKWQGDCFVFDERISLGQGLEITGEDKDIAVVRDSFHAKRDGE